MTLGRPQPRRIGPLRKSRGVTLIELAMAMAVLTTGALGVLMLALTAVQSNARNKLDNGATGVAHTLLEQMVARSSQTSAGTTFFFSDCRAAESGGPQSWTIETASAASPGAGATIDPASGGVDYTQSYGSVPFNYKMRFVACGPAGKQATYDVRWNVRDTSSITRLVTVSVRPLGAEGVNKALVYSRPVTLRSFVSY